jgi:hypothetical protein
MIKVLHEYLLKNWVVYSLLFGYSFLLVLNALGLHIWLPGCLVTELTGYECLGCGINRAAMALISGDIKGAALFNPLIFIYVPMISGWIIYDFYKFYRNNYQAIYEKYR